MKTIKPGLAEPKGLTPEDPETISRAQPEEALDLRAALAAELWAGQGFQDILYHRHETFSG